MSLWLSEMLEEGSFNSVTDTGRSGDRVWELPDSGKQLWLGLLLSNSVEILFLGHWGLRAVVVFTLKRELKGGHLTRSTSSGLTPSSHREGNRDPKKVEALPKSLQKLVQLQQTCKSSETIVLEPTATGQKGQQLYVLARDQGSGVISEGCRVSSRSTNPKSRKENAFWKKMHQ